MNEAIELAELVLTNSKLRSLVSAAKVGNVQHLAAEIAALANAVGMGSALETLRTQKVLSQLRNSELLGSLWHHIDERLGAGPDQDVLDLRHHVEVCTRVQQIFEEIDKLSSEIPTLRAERDVFRLHALRKVELHRLEVHRAIERVDTRSLSPTNTSELWTIFDSQQRQLCDAVNILISQNNRIYLPGHMTVDDKEFDELVFLAEAYDITQTMFDEYSYCNVKITVHQRSTVFGPMYSDQFSLASHWADLRVASADRVTDISFRTSLHKLIRKYSTEENSHSTFERFLLSSSVLSEIFEILEPRYQRQERDLGEYVDLDGAISSGPSGETVRDCLRAWNCLYAIALTARAWAESQAHGDYARDPVPLASASTIVRIIQSQSNTGGPLAQELLLRFVASDEGRADLFLRPLLRLGSGMFALPVTHIETSRMDRNMLSIAVSEGQLDQSAKGRKATILLENEFEAAGFRATCDFPLLADGLQKTDLDIAAIKDGVLFLGQSKVVIHPDSPYERWKIHQKLLTAAKQMAQSLAHLQPNLPKLMDRLRLDCPPQTVVPFLLTSAWQFTGTQIGDYPVVDFSYLAMLLAGAEISLLEQDAEGSIRVSVKRMIRGKQPTGDELRMMIEDPLHRAMFHPPPNSRLGLIQIGKYKVHVPFRSFEPRKLGPDYEMSVKQQDT